MTKMDAFTISMSGPFPSGTVIKRLGGPNEGGHSGKDWYIQFGMDLGVSAGTEVHAAFDAHVTRFTPHTPSKDSSKVYGAQIFMRSPNDGMGAFYTHISSVPAGIKVGATVTRGDLLGTVFVVSGGAPHLHMAMVEIIGGAPGGEYTGVDLYDKFLVFNADSIISVTFNQDHTPPSVA
jgi:murein DD-endopeptidase MepM/ murein hydrolase activator NlpD